MNAPRWLLLLFACPLLLAAGCESASDDDVVVSEEPAGCENFSLQNILYEFEVDNLGDLFGEDTPDQTDTVYWTAEAQAIADSGGYAVLALGPWPLVVASHEPVENKHLLRLEFRDKKGLTLLAVDFTYFLPQGKTIPVALGETVNWMFVWNFVSAPATAPIIMDEEGILLFYGEPGANGLTFNNDPYYPDQDNNPTSNPLFQSVIPRDQNCSAMNFLDCGDQYDLEMEFTPWEGESLVLWPGESASFLFGDEGAEQEYEVTNVWSFDWRNMNPDCQGPQYERNFAFFVLNTSHEGT